MLRTFELLENNPEWLAEILTSPHIAGELGLEHPIAPESTQEDIERNLVEAINDLKPEVENSSGLSELLELHSSLIKLITPVEVDAEGTEVGSEFEFEEFDYPAPLHLRFGLAFPQQVLATLDNISDTSFCQRTLKFGRLLKQQKQLEQAAMTSIRPYLEDREYSVSYINEFYSSILENISRLEELKSADDVELNEYKDLYLESCRYFEYASPIAIVITAHLDEEEIEFDEAANMSLSNSLNKIQSIDYFTELAEPIDSNIRNAIAHGGPRAGVNLNPIENIVTFRYESGDEVREKEMLLSDFKSQVMTAMAAAITLYTLPHFLYYQALHTKFEEAYS